MNDYALRSRFNQIVCPRCYSALAIGTGFLVCSGCCKQYPLAADFPILLTSKLDVAVAGAYEWVEREITKLETQIHLLEAEMWDDAAWDLQRVRIIDALSHNLGLMSKIKVAVGSITKRPSKRGTLKDANLRPEYLDFTAYLERDWSHEVESEILLETIRSALVEALSRAGGPRESAVVLGAGMGRFAVDSTSWFKTVLAFDNSITMLVAFHFLRTAPFDYYNIDQKSAESMLDQIRLVTLSMEDAKNSGALNAGRFLYLAADCREMPLLSGTVSSVLSIFFSDTVPLPGLLDEVSRVLAPSGTFIHFGPLQFHFRESRAMMPMEGVRGLLAGRGFDLIYDERVFTTHRRHARSWFSMSYRNWCFVARKRGGPAGED